MSIWPLFGSQLLFTIIPLVTQTRPRVGLCVSGGGGRNRYGSIFLSFFRSAFLSPNQLKNGAGVGGVAVRADVEGTVRGDLLTKRG